jgi:ubiquinone/menaquinone biosynthesis C-methylase UbiE
MDVSHDSQPELVEPARAGETGSVAKVEKNLAETPALHFQLHQRILAWVGHRVEPPAAVLDFGCGAGAMVDEYCRRGYDAYGCDIAPARATDRLRLISQDPYRLPFERESFDYVFSDQVFEHVSDHQAAIDEIWRVLKPGAVSLHIFPPRLVVIEPHVRVPLAGAIQSKRWLRLWAALGIRNEYQSDRTAAEVTQLNHSYLSHHTNYLSKRELVAILSSRFSNITFAERAMVEHSYGCARLMAPLARRMGWVASLYSNLYTRVVVLRKETVAVRPVPTGASSTSRCQESSCRSVHRRTEWSTSPRWCSTIRRSISWRRR